jgi:uncharacterized iron-regulated membrane protein
VRNHTRSLGQGSSCFPPCVLRYAEKLVTFWQSWARRPQDLWVRKALFQIHLWLGIGIGLYVVLISVSGSMVVYRRELSRKFARRRVFVTELSHRMSLDELRQAAQRHYPAYEVNSVLEPRERNQPVTVVLERNTNRKPVLFDPYTGADLGNPVSRMDAAIQWVVDLHGDLLLGKPGRFVNGIGSALVTLIALSGIVIWWPGVKNWRRSLAVSWKANFARFNWDLHSAIGFWSSWLVLIWGISGLYLCFPQTFNSVFNVLDPHERYSDIILLWLTRLHFGRFSPTAEVVWTILGLVPAVSFVTGALMWWNRVLRKQTPKSEKEGTTSQSRVLSVSPLAGISFHAKTSGPSSEKCP